VDSDRIALIAVTNIPHFSTHHIGDVIVTDDMLVQRFFGDPEVNLVRNGKPIATLAAVRPAGEVTPEMFFEYLRSPLQVRIVDAALDENTMWLPAVDEQPAIATTYMAYHPVLPPLVSALLHQIDPDQSEE
jgi:hypothetical protein